MGPIAAELSDAQMQDVAAYYGGLRGVPYPPELRHDQQLVEQGRKIAAAGLADQGVPACETCHGKGGVGNAPLYPYLAGQYRPYLEHQLQQFKAGRRGGDPMDVMHAIAAPLTDGQVHALAVYFASLRPQPTTPGEAERRPARLRPPAPLPMQTGAVIDIEPGHDDVVLPER
jgi:cytochrome c553